MQTVRSKGLAYIMRAFCGLQLIVALITAFQYFNWRSMRFWMPISPAVQFWAQVAFFAFCVAVTVAIEAIGRRTDEEIRFLHSKISVLQNRLDDIERKGAYKK